MQRLAEQLTAVHAGTREFGYYLAQRRLGEGSLWEGERYRRLEPVGHPVVRVHSKTGRRSLFVKPGFTSHIVGVSGAESRHLLGAVLRVMHRITLRGGEPVGIGALR